MNNMNKFKCLAMVAGGLFIAAWSAPKAQAQVSVSIGAAPVCPYGYYDYAPYACAPYGYYGPEWFNGGAFIGVGPWFHGDEHFHGHVNNHFDVHHGYHGAMPHAGDHAERGRDVSHMNNFHGNEMHDGHGHVVGGGHEARR
jgi:hypothetical protein